MGIVLAIGLLAFVGVASAVLLWDGLSEVSPGEAAVHAHAHARARVLAGAVGFALALWLAIGLVTHAH